MLCLHIFSSCWSFLRHGGCARHLSDLRTGRAVNNLWPDGASIPGAEEHKLRNQDKKVFHLISDTFWGLAKNSAHSLAPVLVKCHSLIRFHRSCLLRWAAAPSGAWRGRCHFAQAGREGLGESWQPRLDMDEGADAGAPEQEGPAKALGWELTVCTAPARSLHGWRERAETERRRGALAATPGLCERLLRVSWAGKKERPCCASELSPPHSQVLL